MSETPGLYECLDTEDKTEITDNAIAAKLPSVLAMLGVGGCVDEDGLITVASPLDQAVTGVYMDCASAREITRFYVHQTHVAQCYLTSVSNTIETSALVDQKVQVVLGPGSLLQCANGLDISQRALVDVLQQGAIEPAAVDELAEEIGSELYETLGGMESTWLDTVEGQQSLELLLLDIQTKVQGGVFTEVINEVISGVTAAQNIQIYLGRNSVLRAENCLITQDIIVRLVSQSIITNLLQVVFDDSTGRKFLEDGATFHEDHFPEDTKQKEFQTVLGVTVGVAAALLILVLVLWGLRAASGDEDGGDPKLQKGGLVAIWAVSFVLGMLLLTLILRYSDVVTAD